ncbi:BTB/POZ domain-containing protein [Ditylenchus destructor]|uniref:BTB/POZ domain-containing protein n=1 Tax=Ditylenchus destructor TaxID=166010 RepID=A0AAD4NAJ1_9BILA|nr:BTB/POZ domain-containing protein [Ditylenchus destructor]
MVIDFSVPNALRQFELVVADGRSLWANGHYLAEISPYFYALCVAGDFKERRLGRVELKDVAFDDLHELLRCICPNEDFVYENRIDADNFALLTNLSGRLLLQNLREQLEKFARQEHNFDYASTTTLLESIVECHEAKFNDDTVTALCRRLAKHDQNEIKKITQTLPDKYSLLVEEKIQPLLEFYQHPATVYGSQSAVIAGSPHHWNIRLFF